MHAVDARPRAPARLLHGTKPAVAQSMRHAWGVIIEKRVWRAPVGSDHTLGRWEETSPLPVARGHVHQLPLVGDRVYSVGGALDLDLNSTPQIALGSFR